MNSQPLTPFAANPFVFIVSAMLLVAALAYFGWGALDRLGLAEQSARGTVTGKHYNPPGRTWHTTIAGGRAWSLPDTTSETYVLLLTVEQTPTVAIVDKALYDAVQAGDVVNVRLRRTRLSDRLEVIAVGR